MTSSKIFFYYSLSFVLGISIASFFFVSSFSLYFVVGSIIFFLIFINQKGKILFFAFLFFFMGVIYYQIREETIDENHIAFLNGEKIVFQGKIIKEIDERLNNIKVTFGNIVVDGKCLNGKVLVNALLYSDYQYGDVLEVECKIEHPGIIEDFDYGKYLSRYGIYSVCYWPKIKIIEKSQQNSIYAKILKFKRKGLNFIITSFPEPHATFLSAILLGFKRQIPVDMRSWFSLSGVSHLLAISGIHIAILIQIIAMLLTNIFLIKRQKTFIPTIFIISLFIILIGAPASAIRASLMGLVFLLANRIERPYSVLNSLVLVGVLMLLINPKFLIFDIGFQLSFLAVLGIYLFYKLFNKCLRKIPDYRFLPLRSYLSITLSAQILVFPLVLYYFGNLSLISPVVNILILLVIPIVMLLGFFFIFASFISFWLAQIFFWPVWILITYIILVTKSFSSIPYLSFVITDFPLSGAIVIYILLFLFFFNLYFTKKIKSKSLEARSPNFSK